LKRQEPMLAKWRARADSNGHPLWWASRTKPKKGNEAPAYRRRRKGWSDF